MSDENVIVLSDDCSDADELEKEKSKESNDDDCLVVKDKASSDLSESEFPIVRFSEINSRKNFEKDSKIEEPVASCSSGLSSNHIDDIQNFALANLLEKEASDSDLSDINIASNDRDKVNQYNLYDLMQKESSDSDLEEIFNGNLTSRDLNGDNQASSDSDDESQYPLKKNLVSNQVAIELSDEEGESVKNKKVAKKTVRRRKKASDTANVDEDEDNCSKVTKKRPRARKKTPQDYLKLMEVVIDEEITNYDFYDDFIKATEENEIECSIKPQLVPKSITWKRKIEEPEDEEDAGLTIIDENHVMIIWNCEETVKQISENIFLSTISNLTSIFPNKRISLIMYKMQSYIKDLKSAKGKTAKNCSDNNKQKKSKAGKGLSSYPRISLIQFKECLVEAQLLFNLHSKLVDNPDEIILMIKQYTKSLANLPLKLEKDKINSQFDWCISAHKKNPVKVDQDGHGLTRLWQQQLCQFPQTSLETAEAIVSVYETPLQLMEAYSKCSKTEGEQLLKDIPIRRNAGILTSSKKIGPELSRKIYIMFTSTDGEVYLK